MVILPSRWAKTGGDSELPAHRKIYEWSDALCFMDEVPSSVKLRTRAKHKTQKPRYFKNCVFGYEMHANFLNALFGISY